MSNSMESMRRKMTSAADLQSVVRTMKAMAAANIGQYEKAVDALEDYYQTVQAGLAACFRPGVDLDAMVPSALPPPSGAIGAVIFGSDQGMVGQFNDALVVFALDALKQLPGKKTVWAVGERVEARLQASSLTLGSRFTLPSSIGAITPLIGQILIEMAEQQARGAITQVYLLYNRPESGSVYTPVIQRLLPLDALWHRELATRAWPSNNLPQVLNGRAPTLLALVHEYLFVSLFRACAESLASENASRLVAMQRAEKNIDELLQQLNNDFHRERQNGIDEELFDLVSGFEALGDP